MTKEKIVEALKSQSLWRQKLKNDCVRQNIFLAIRNSHIDFYHKGGRLFSFDGKDFKTHVKYAAVIDLGDERESDYLTEKGLENHKLLSDFEAKYDRIKENCSKYQGVEASGVSEIYRRHSYLSNENVVVLDIEASFKSLEVGKKQDRIDILLFNKESKVLQFVEAKHYINNEIWSKSIPRAVKQIKRYEGQVASRVEGMLERWSESVTYLNKLFGTSLPTPKAIDDKVTLLVFGFDNDQKNGRLTKLIIKNREYSGVRVYPKGDISTLNPKALWNAKVLHDR